MSKCQFCGQSFEKMFQFNDGSIICMNCYSRYQSAQESNQRGLERMMNYLTDEIEAAVGIPLSSPRFPEPKPPVYMNNPTVNNMNIQNSIVGAVNQGSVENMNVSLRNVSQNNSIEAQLIKTFTELFLQSEEIQKEQKEEILEQLSFLTTQLTKPEEKRPQPIIKTMIENISNILKGSKFLLEFWTVIQALFNTNK